MSPLVFNCRKGGPNGWRYRYAELEGFKDRPVHHTSVKNARKRRKSGTTMERQKKPALENVLSETRKSRHFDSPHQYRMKSKEGHFRTCSVRLMCHDIRALYPEETTWINFASEGFLWMYCVLSSFTANCIVYLHGSKA